MGRTYRVEYIHRSEPDQLDPLGSNRVATGARLEVEDNIGPDVQRFYRVVQVD